MKGGRFFLDTNVFVYSFETNEPRKLRSARNLISEAITTGRGVISYQVVQEFFNVAFRKFPTPFSQSEALMYFSSTLRPLLSVSFSPALLFRAIRIRETHYVSWYDSLIFAAALETECDTLYSEDFQDGLNVDGLTIQNPFL
jgi:predicted nucleic acid-binding protein